MISTALFFLVVSGLSGWGFLSLVLAPVPYYIAALISFKASSDFITIATYFTGSALWFGLMFYPHSFKRRICGAESRIQILLLSLAWVFAIPICFVLLLPNLSN